MVILAACNSQSKYTDYDYSFSRSGGNKPFYENLWIKGNTATYSLEKDGKKVENKFTLSEESLKNIQNVLTENNFRMIEEDHQKVYDNITTIIVVKKGDNSASKSNASFIMKKDQQRWEKVVETFRNIIEANQTASK
jgi:hypothetical protein